MRPESREQFGWCVYDWANSAFATTILAAVLPVYFAEVIVPKSGVVIAVGGYAMQLSATSLWGYASGLTAFLVMISAPFLGGIADYTFRKKHFLTVFCYLGAFFTILLWFSGPGTVFFALLLFSLAHYCFVGGNVFYDAFLPFMASGKGMDRLSGQGFALGYLGGGLLLAVNVLFIQFSGRFGVSPETAVRAALTSAGLWWAGFGTLSFLMFHETRPAGGHRPGVIQAARVGWRRTWQTTRTMVRHRQILVFLLAYMVYNDGVQTVIKMASIYGKDELDLSTGTLLGTLLMVQFLGIGGALLMSRVAVAFGAKRTIMAALLVWLGLTVYAYNMDSPAEYWGLGMVVGLVLGGTQALSRSLYGSLIPRDQSAQFYGYFSVFAKFSAIWGPILFAFIRQVTGTARLSILSLSLFFLLGWVLLFFVKGSEGDEEAVLSHPLR